MGGARSYALSLQLISAPFVWYLRGTAEPGRWVP